MSSMLRFQIRYHKSGSLYYQGGRNSSAAQKFVRKPTRMLGTPLGFSCTCLKQHSRHAVSQQASSIMPSPLPGAPHWVWLWHTGAQLTGLETRFQHVWWNGNCPVEDPSQAPSKQDPRHTEVTHTVAGSEWGGRKKWKKYFKKEKEV